MGAFSIWHWIIVLIIVLLLFGKGKIPSLMADMAKGIKSFKSNMADDDKPTNMVFSSISFAGGGFRTISYAPSVFYLYESKRIDENTTYHGKQTNEKASNYAHFICPVP